MWSGAQFNVQWRQFNVQWRHVKQREEHHHTPILYRNHNPRGKDSVIFWIILVELLFITASPKHCTHSKIVKHAKVYEQRVQTAGRLFRPIHLSNCITVFFKEEEKKVTFFKACK